LALVVVGVGLVACSKGGFPNTWVPVGPKTVAPGTSGRSPPVAAVHRDGNAPQEDPLHRRPAVAGLLSLAAFVAVACSMAQRATAEEEVTAYFGVGNFSHLQHEFVLKEALLLGRRGPDIQSLTGFAGGTRTGNLDRLCYRDLKDNYVGYGHGEVVSITVPKNKFTDFAKLYFDQLPKRKSSEKGSQYRPMIGIRGGLKSPLVPLIEEAGGGDVKLVKGNGDDQDSLGPSAVYLYDSRALPFRPAEVYNQFKDDPPERYEFDYREIAERLKKIGAISSTGCP